MPAGRKLPKFRHEFDKAISFFRGPVDFGKAAGITYARVYQIREDEGGRVRNPDLAKRIVDAVAEKGGAVDLFGLLYPKGANGNGHPSGRPKAEAGRTGRRRTPSFRSTAVLTPEPASRQATTTSRLVGTHVD